MSNTPIMYYVAYYIIMEVFNGKGGNIRGRRLMKVIVYGSLQCFNGNGDPYSWQPL